MKSILRKKDLPLLYGVNAGPFRNHACGYIVRKYLGAGIWTSRILCSLNVTILFHSNIFEKLV
jgi:hypothetical protein